MKLPIQIDAKKIKLINGFTTMETPYGIIQVPFKANYSIIGENYQFAKSFQEFNLLGNKIYQTDEKPYLTAITNWTLAK